MLMWQVIGLTQTAAAKLCSDKIRVNCVAPTSVATVGFGCHADAAGTTHVIMHDSQAVGGFDTYHVLTPHLPMAAYDSQHPTAG